VEVRDRILDESQRLFFKYGVKRVTMDDVAKSLSISKKTLYQNFSDKDQLVEEVTKSHLEQEQVEMEDTTKSAQNAIEELYLVSKCIRKNISDINPTVLFDLKRFYPNSYKHWSSFKEEFIADSIINNLKKGIDDGYFRKDLNLEIMAKLRLMEIQLLFDSDMFPYSQFDFKEVQIQLFNHFVFGIVTKEGRKLYSEYIEKEKTEKYA